MPIQPCQVIDKPEPRGRWDHTASREAGGRVQVNPMQCRGIGSLTLEEVKMLTGIHRQMHVKLAHLTVQILDSISREEGIDLVEDRARLVLHDKAVLQDIAVQGGSWEEPQPTNLLCHEWRETAYVAKAQVLQPIEQEGVIRTEDRHASVECRQTRQIKVIEMPMRYNNALQRWELR